MANAPPAADSKKPAATAPPAKQATPSPAAPAQGAKGEGTGNSAQRFDRMAVRAKLAVSEPGDAVEREADQIADRVMRAPDPSAAPAKPASKPAPDAVQRAPQPAADAKKPPAAPPSSSAQPEVKRAAAPALAHSEAPQPVSAASLGQNANVGEDVKRKGSTTESAKPGGERPGSTQEILARLGPGAPLDADTRTFFQTRLGHDLSEVRIHTDEAAALVARELSARAFTFGNHVAFAQGEYQPDSESGKRLIAHELAHVLQNDDFAVRHVVLRKPDPRFKNPNDIAPEAIDPDKHKTAKPRLTTLALPAIKSRHSTVYQGLAKQKKLKRPAGYDRQTAQFATNQKANWTAGVDLSSKYKDIDFDKSKSPVSLPFYGNKKTALKGTPGEVEERLKIPNWTEEGVWRDSALQVDHIVECQVGGPDAIGNYELLTGAANINVGSLLRAVIYANVKEYLRLVDKNTGDPLVKDFLKKYDVDFETVTAGGEGKNVEKDSRFWSEKQIKAGDHLKWLKPDPAIAGVDGGPNLFALFSPTGNALIQVFPRSGTKVTITDKGRLTGMTMTSFDLNASFDTAAHEAQIGTLTATWNVPKAMALKQKGDIAIPILKIGAKKYAGALGNFPAALSADLKGASPVEFADFSIVGKDLYAEGKLKPTMPLLEGLEIPVQWKGDDVAFSFVIPIDQLKGKLPIPGLTIEDADLTLFFGSAKLGAEGSVQFSIANIGGGSLSARVEAKKGEPTFGLKGWIEVDRKLFDKSRLELWYSTDDGFGGKGLLEITQPGRIKGLKSARIEAGYTKGEFFAKGGAQPDIPGLKSADIAISYKDSVLALKGDVSLDEKVPGVQSAAITVEVKKNGDDWKVSASGDVRPKIPGLPDTTVLKACYDDGFFLVEGTFDFEKKPLLKGTIKAGVTNADVDRAGKRSDKGEGKSLRVFGNADITVKLTDDLTGTVGLRLTPSAKVLVKGGFDLKPKQLFAQYPKPEDAKKTLLELSTPRIPVPGLAISFGGAAIGLTVVIKGGVYSDAHVGPGMLTGANVGIDEYDLNDPLDAIKVHGGGNFEVPSKAALAAGVQAKVNLDAGVLGVGGGIAITGEIGVEPKVEAGVKFSWSSAKGLDVEGDVAVSLKPILTLSIDGVVSVEATLIVKTITLWERRFPGPKISLDPGITLAGRMKAGWNSKTNEPRMEAPKFDTPTIDKGSLIAKVFGSSKQEQAVTVNTETKKVAGETLVCSADQPLATFAPPQATSAPPVSRMARDNEPPPGSAHAMAAPAPTAHAPTMTESAIADLGSGQPLELATRGFFELRLGRDLTGVRIHAGTLADAAARKISARAFTVGQHIVFAEGEYDPASETGKALLAHELAHVVQQAGGAARIVMRITAPAAGAAPAATAGAPPAKPATPEYRVATPLEIPQIKARHGSTYLAYAGAGSLRRPHAYDSANRGTAQVAKWIAALKLDPRKDLPAKHHPAPGAGWTLPLQKRGGADVKTITAKDDGELRERLKRPDWDIYAEDKTFQVDHMLEIQLGGEDVPANMELLDQAHNGSVGTSFNHAVRRAIVAELAAHPLPPAAGLAVPPSPTVEFVKNNYDVVFTSVAVRGSQSKKGAKELDSRFWSLSAIGSLEHVKSLLPGEGGNLAGTPQKLVLQSPTGSLVIERFGVAGNVVKVDKGQAGGIAGYAIDGVNLDAIGGHDKLAAGVTKPDTPVGQLEGVLNLGSGVVFPAGADRHALPIVKANDAYAVKIASTGVAGSKTGTTNLVPATFVALSPMEITGLTFGRSVFASAAIHPTHPALAGLRIPAQVRNGKLGLYYTVDAASLAARLRVPGLTVDDASITFGYDGDAFSAAGGAVFTIRNFGTGTLDAKVDSKGRFELAGGFRADPRLFDRADMRIWYRSEAGFGGTGILAIDKPGKIRGIKSAAVNASYDAGVLTAKGTVQPAIPGVQNATLGVRYGPDESGADSLLIEGDLALAAGIPGLDSGSMHVNVVQRDEAWRVAARGEIVPHLPGLSPVIKVAYDDGLFTGEAQAAFSRSIFAGQANVGLTNRAVSADGEISGTEPGKELRLYGAGTLTARVTDWLSGSVGMKVKPNGTLLISGRIGVPAAVTIFEQFPPPERATRELVRMPTVSLPLFGFAVGGNVVGVALTISGRVTAHAFVGPGQLTQAEINVVDFDPAQPDSLHLTGRAQFNLPGEAGVDAALDAGVSAGAAVVRVTAGVSVTAGAAVRANVTPTVALDYKPASGLHLHADLAASLAPRLRFGVNGYAEVVADAFVTSFTLWRKDWRLAQKEIGSSLALGLNVPVDYYSDGRGVVFDPNRVTFQVPSLSLDTFKELMGSG